MLTLSTWLRRKFLTCWWIVICALGLGTGSLHAEFVFHDGDTVVFLGDSITEARSYTKTVELYTLMRFPDRRGPLFQRG